MIRDKKAKNAFLSFAEFCIFFGFCILYFLGFAVYIFFGFYVEGQNALYSFSFMVIVHLVWSSGNSFLWSVMFILSYNTGS